VSDLASSTSAALATVISDETGTGALVFGTSPTFTTQITVPKIYYAGDPTIDAYSDSADTTVTITNSSSSYVANLVVEGTIASLATGGPSYVSLSDNTTLASPPTFGYYFLASAPTVAINGVSYGLMVNPMTTAGDIIVGSTSGSPSRLGIGSDGQVLTVSSGSLTWSTPSGTGDVVGGTASATGEIATYSSTSGKAIGRSYAILSGPATTAKTYTLPNQNATIVCESVATGGLLLGDSTPDANGEIGYASNAFTLYGGGEDLSITASTNTWTLGSSTGVTTFALGSLGLTTSSTIAATGNVSGAAFVPTSAADAAGEIGYASNAFSIYANSENLVLTAGTNKWTLSSSTGVTDIDLGSLNIVGNRFLDSAPDSNSSVSGDVITVVAATGYNAVFGDLVVVTGWSTGVGPIVAKADADSSSTVGRLYLIAESISAGSSGKALRSGIARYDSWSWSTSGGALYVSDTAGGMTQTAPSSTGQQVQIVGHALTSTIIDFNPSPIVIELN